MTSLFLLFRKAMAVTFAIVGGGVTAVSLVLYGYSAMCVWQNLQLKTVGIYFALAGGGILVFWFGCYLSVDPENLEKDLARLSRTASTVEPDSTNPRGKSVWPMMLLIGLIVWDVWDISRGHAGFANILVAVFVGSHLSLCWHELAHLVSGLALGMSPTVLVAGSGPVLWAGRVGQVDVRISLFPTSGWVRGSIWKKPGYRWRNALFSVAGPVADVLGFFALAMAATAVAGGRTTPSAIVLYQSAGILLFWQGRFCFSSIIPQEITVQGKRLFSDGHTVTSIWAWSERGIALLCGYASLADFERHRDVKKGKAQLASIQQDVGRFPDCTSLLCIQAWLQTTLGDTNLTPIFCKLLTRPDLDEMTRRYALYKMRGIMAQSWTVEAIREETNLWLAANPDPMARAEMLDTLACSPIFHGRSDLLPDALKWVQEAIRLHPSAITLQGTLGSLYMEMEQWEEGAVLLRETLEKTTQANDKAICHFYLGRYFQNRGEEDQARDHFQQSRSFQPAEWLVKRLEAVEAGGNF